MSADQNNPRATFQYALHLYKGTGIPKDTVLANSLFRRATQPPSSTMATTCSMESGLRRTSSRRVDIPKWRPTLGTRTRSATLHAHCSTVPECRGTSRRRQGTTDVGRVEQPGGAI
jgi:hypothetical protein